MSDGAQFQIAAPWLPRWLLVRAREPGCDVPAQLLRERAWRSRAWPSPSAIASSAAWATGRCGSTAHLSSSTSTRPSHWCAQHLRSRRESAARRESMSALTRAATGCHVDAGPVELPHGLTSASLLSPVLGAWIQLAAGGRHRPHACRGTYSARAYHSAQCERGRPGARVHMAARRCDAVQRDPLHRGLARCMVRQRASGSAFTPDHEARSRPFPGVPPKEAAALVTYMRKDLG
jgi:hypothetical protein